MWISTWLSNLFTAGTERPSPSDIVPKDSIGIVAADKLSILIDLTKLNIPFGTPPKVWVPDIPDTGSMDPNFDHEHNNILIAGADEADHKRLIDFIKVGDIAVYRIPPDFSQPARIYAIHRIVKIGKDSQRRYFVFKGDNNASSDPYKVRDNEILWVSISTIF